MINKLNTLIVDDEAELRRSVISILKTSMPEIDFEIEEASTGKEAFEKVQAKQWDLVLMDVKMPEMNGIEALTAIKEHDPRTFVMLMTAHSNLHDAVLAIKEGAYDYVEKPVKPELLAEIVRKSIEARDLVSSLALSNPVFDDDIESEFVGDTSKMKEVFNLIYRLCKVDTTVLVRGENGTGKELVARAIHFNSPRKSGSFVAINCGAIPESLMESELFGHEKGAFTGAVERKIGKFQVANNGTLFLDEIGELKPDMQVKLLRVLQDRKFTPVGSNREVKTTTRIIAATNRNLEKMMEEGTFREDLFYRLNVMPIFMPPLRERTDDIDALVQNFIKKFAKQHGRVISGVSPEALDMLKSYRWPGNIRELENVIERAFIVENSHVISVDSLPDSIKLSPKESPDKTTNVGYSGPLDFDAFKEEMEKEFIISALKANNGRINQTVAQANIPKNTLLRKIRKYGINVKDYTSEE
ncbi:two-component system response regulator [Bdellovibrio bacteriovorus]|uniref:Two-component system response regulator n=1 Tax=Bdellovibrio bacteriovorus TaxID=959 RepID=A0A150WLR3_BDEBC|nr:sigma-54 dependent transcriptional regulator [Bdellovibrio bacteriovorus]KYG64951.1 two-component system response regulator [Bdellovibrio bacteriovorus]